MKKNLQVVGAMLQNEEGRVLAVLRPKDKTMGNFWEFPGGKIEEGESKEEAIIREIKEELDCDIIVKECVGVSSKDYGDGSISLSIFRCEMKNEITIKEHDAYVWLKIDNLMSLVWTPIDLPILKEIQKKF